MKLQINSLFKEYRDRQILDGVSFTIQDRDRIGLVGTNGSGKTTILKLASGLEISEGGQIIKSPQDLNVGYIPQVVDLANNKNILEGLADSVGLDESEIYKIYIALDDLGIGDLATQTFGTLSSGQKTKVYLTRLLVQKPDILLLDEPTNHLDIESLEWLETYLKSYQGAFVIVSHDRKFLDNTVTKILELEEGKIKVYGGNYSFYRQQKAIELEAQQRQYENQQQKINRLEKDIQNRKESIKRLGKSDHPTRDNDKYAATFFAGRATRKYSQNLKAFKSTLSQLEIIEKPKTDLELSVLFQPRRECSKTVVFLDKVSKTFGNHRVLSNFSLVINQGDRVALIGPNGSGKSTIINLILGKFDPTKGRVEIGNSVDVGYLPQEHGQLDSNLTPVDYLISFSKIDRTSAHRLVKRFLFTDEVLRTSVNKLSSGQKSKLLLASIMAMGANFIILDEPTNYLDIPSREAVEEALVSYPGTLLVVTHDRFFLDRINPTSIINLAKKKNETN